MFTTNHFIWLAICAVYLAALIAAMVKFKPSQKLVLTIACIVAATAEVVKTLARVVILQTTSGGYTAYIETQYIPLHLCSIQIFFIFAIRFMKDGRIRNALLAFMYPTCVIGPIFSLLMPTVFNNTDVSRAFTSVMPYQYFLYHTSLIALGIYIAKSGMVKFRAAHIATSMAVMGVLAYFAIYVNSALASVDYSSGTAVVESVTNFFFVYGLPVDLFTITKKWQWLLYFFCLVALVAVVFTLMYLPFILRNRKNGDKQEQPDGSAYDIKTI